MAAAAAAAPSPNTTTRHNVPRRRRLIGQRRRLEDEDGADDDRSHNAVDFVDDDSLTEGSIGSEDREAAQDSDTSNIDEASPTVPVAHKQSTGQGHGHGNGIAAKSRTRKYTDAQGAMAAPADSGIADAEVSMRGLSVSDQAAAASEQQAVITAAPSAAETTNSTAVPSSPSVPASRPPQPAIVSSSSAQPQRRETAYEKQRREHDLYKQKRDEDPSFVPNRGAFFMHDHRGAGPAANGFRPFGRPGRGGRGRGGFAGSFSPLHGPFHNQADPTVNAPWAHDMHDVVAQPNPSRLAMARRQNYETGSQYGGSQVAAAAASTIPTCPPSAVPINRSMSVEKQLGTLTVRVFFPPMKEPVLFEKFKVVQYTKLPDHRPPLRRDKAVVIDLPGHPKHQIFPAVDRSFIFIPRALRPNQQRLRGNRTRSVMGSISGFSRRTSLFGGSYYNGSMYSPSIALSRRSSIAPDVGRDFIISPTGSAVSRPPLTMDNAPRPVVRLPPAVMPPNQTAAMMPGVPLGGVPGLPMSGPIVPPIAGAVPVLPSFPSHPSSFVSGPAGPPPQPPQPPPVSNQPTQRLQQQPQSASLQPASLPSQPPQPSETSSSLSTVPPPQNHPLPQKPTFQENRPSHNLPMHQPRPQKTVSVENIESPTAVGAAQPPPQQPYSMPFHQQVPIQMANGFPPGESHTRHPSFHSHTTGTPLSQIPERAIHAAPFQPNQPGQPGQPGQPAMYPQPSTGAASGAAYYGPTTGYSMMQPPSQQGYFYPTPPSYPSTIAASGAAPAFVPRAVPQGPGPVYGQTSQGETIGTPISSQPNMVAQEVNGMVYYLDASQMSGVPSYSSYAPAPPQGSYIPGMGGMVTPAPADGYYYTPQPSVVYYPQ